MFSRRIEVLYTPEGECGAWLPAPLHWIDNFAMRSFTNDAVFDDTLPVADGLMEIGRRVPLELLGERMSEWFQRKGYIGKGKTVELREL